MRVQNQELNTKWNLRLKGHKVVNLMEISMWNLIDLVNDFAPRCPAGTLTSGRCMQVPCRYPHQRQGYASALQVPSPVSGVCRCPAGILTSVRGTQMPFRYPHQRQGYTGALQAPSQAAGVYKNQPIESMWIGVSHEDFLFAPACPIEKVTLWEGLLCLILGAEADEGVVSPKPRGIESGPIMLSIKPSFHLTPLLTCLWGSLW